MIILRLAPDAPSAEAERVVAALTTKKRRAEAVVWEGERLVVLSGQEPPSPEELRALPAVSSVTAVRAPYPLASREWHPADSVVRVGGVAVGGGRGPVIIAGPCSVESEVQIRSAAEGVKKAGAHILRGGAFKPRTNPYSFQGLGVEGLKLLKEAGAAVGLPVVTEVMSPGAVELVAEYADMLQIGARNMANFELLRAVGKSGRPVLLKRGMAATVDEWLQAAEYILAAGNSRVVLCERGIRGFDPATRNTLDLAGAVLAKQKSHLPVLVDPSHGTGVVSLIGPLSLAAVAAGLDGLCIEVHPNPQEAYSDGEQALTPRQLEQLVRQVRRLAAVRPAGEGLTEAPGLG